MEHMAFMARCIQLAQNGLGTTYPNPLVGSVIVHSGKIIGEGWHYKSGGPHAEVVAISSVADAQLLKTATLYVNLEPCSHFGKTPPCADLIIRSGITKVVIGCKDPNPAVAGNGIRKLNEAGIETAVGVLEDECRLLNKRFFTFHEKRRPYIILKWAQSADGFFAPNANSGKFWLSGRLSRRLVHKMRSEEHAILVGTNTVLIDNPLLDVRDWAGNNPQRFVIDRDAKIPSESNIFENHSSIVFTESGSAGVNHEPIDFKESCAQILSKLHHRSIQSVIVEGGAATLTSFIEAGLWDEAHVFTADTVLDSGIKAPKISGTLTRKTSVGHDELKIFIR